MPTVTNHKGPKFREYRRTQTENDIINLQKTVKELQDEIAQLKQTPNKTKTTAKKSST